MTDEQSNDQPIQNSLADALLEFPKREQKLPSVTDRDILRAMIGKPFMPPQVEKVTLRKAG